MNMNDKPDTILDEFSKPVYKLLDGIIAAQATLIHELVRKGIISQNDILDPLISTVLDHHAGGGDLSGMDPLLYLIRYIEPRAVPEEFIHRLPKPHNDILPGPHDD